MPRWSAVVMLSLAAALGACGRDRAPDVAASTPQGPLLGPGNVPLVGDPAVVDFVNELGLAIARRTSRPDLQWRFYVVNDPRVNAFAVPGGEIYVNRGLIDHADRLDQLAGVLGHEIGHVVEQHALQEMEKGAATSIALGVVCEYTSLCDDRRARAAIGVGAAALTAHYSRSDEASADSEAVVNVTRAGFDPEGVPSMLEALLATRQASPTVVDEFFSTHPLEEDRIRHTERLVGAIPEETLDGALQDTPQFHAFKARLAAYPAVR